MPDFQGFVQFDFELLNSLQLNYQNQILGKIYADDANTSFQKSKSISNVSIKYTIEKESYKLSPYFGVNNVFSAKYADNIRINAFGSRYYEAAPDLVLYGGVRVHF